MPAKRYRAFISYSRKDRKWSARLHRWLETYRVPDDLEAKLDASRRLGRFFRDDEELPAAANISDHVGRAIADSESLIAICSPHAARSEWVAAEIRLFRRLGSGRKIFTFVVDGEPNAKDPGADRALAICRQDGGIEVHTSAARDRPAAVLTMDREITLCGGPRGGSAHPAWSARAS